MLTQLWQGMCYEHAVKHIFSTAWSFSVFRLSFSRPLARSTCAFTSGSQLTGGPGPWDVMSHATHDLCGPVYSAEWVKESLRKERHILPIELYTLWADVTDGSRSMNSGVFGWFCTTTVNAVVDGSSPHTEPQPLHCARVTANVCWAPCVMLVTFRASLAAFSFSSGLPLDITTNCNILVNG